MVIYVCYFLLFNNLFMRSLFIRMSFEMSKELIVAEGKEYTRLDIAQTFFISIYVIFIQIWIVRTFVWAYGI